MMEMVSVRWGIENRPNTAKQMYKNRANRIIQQNKGDLTNYKCGTREFVHSH
jgi:hypothetical protein